jgi:hypothetical protein
MRYPANVRSLEDQRANGGLKETLSQLNPRYPFQWFEQY